MDEITAPYAVRELVEEVPLRVHLSTRVAAKTDLGRVRENNEDKFEFFVPSSDALLASRGHVYLVCDGMGGHSAGQIASELAAKTFIDVYLNHPASEASVAAVAAAHAANRFVRDVGTAIPSRRGMGTTLSGLMLIQDQAMIIQIGDSRVYRLRDGVLDQITTDHTWVEDVVQKGLMPREDAERHQYKHVIMQAIGGDADLAPDVFWLDLMPGDEFLLCSDGLTNHVSNPELHEVLAAAGPSEACWQLVNLALAGGGSDNCTALIVSVDAVTAVN